MNDVQLQQEQAGDGKGTLYLQFRIGDQRFALDVHEVIEVLPRRTLKPIAQAPAWVAGILAHRGALVPVVDLSALSFGRPAPMRTSTRLVLVHYRGDQQLGLVLEQATDTLRCRPDEFQPYGLDNTDAPYLGPVRQDAGGLLQRIEVDDLLPDDVRRLLFPELPGQVTA
ncbi:chemotaxis protein CheW [Pseudomonas juntendi]|uniref:Chemotaxis protein CheW n=1 Tax=Pseudomonas putida TaxID=303 RepID=A0A1X0ZWM8_PSEPU|nr:MULTISPECIES: chemotaxis protein CheW [Pseudomonas]MEB3901196.1 chemotaxis protein CheW [Pseudomonas putida]ORL64108.1 chemotaxis protein CheW [Pseudomonas putida]UBM24349.1 chemotaxis protein CheW [Pseudomonas sp. p1(2021b)]